MDVKRLFDARMNRRKLLGNLGMMGAGAALTACAGVVAQPGGPTDAEVDKAILNFALNLEYLEAEFYLAAVGRTPTYESDVTGTVTGGSQVTFATPEFEEYANEIANDEEAHVLFLRSALGSDAVDRPNLNLAGGVGGAFGTAARAAGSTAGIMDEDTLDALETFSPYANELFFLHGAFIFEDVGVTAYKGASPLVTSKAFLEAAAGILAVEAYHASEVRTLLYAERDTVAIPAGALGNNVELRVRDIVGAISALRAALGGGKDQSIIKDGKANIVPADANAIAFSRSPREVLNIVHGAVGASSGLFFPDGLSGDFSLLLPA